MIGDYWVTTEDFITHRGEKIKKYDVLIEKPAYDRENECDIDAEEYNELHHQVYGFICDVGSPVRKKYFERQV